MKNILFIGPYRQTDGWGFAARDYIQALALTKHNISVKPIFLGLPNETGLPVSILQLEKKVFDTRPDVVIQNVLPPYMDYQHGMKNIGLCFLETAGLRHTSWMDKLSLMDEVWVASTTEKHNLENDSLDVPVRVVPMPVDMEAIKNCHQQWPIAGDEDSFVFYGISEYSERKNILALLVAFYSEFHHTEPVQLLLKLHKPGVSETELYQLVAKDLSTLKKRLRLYNNGWGYNDILLVVQNLSPQDMTSIHNRCNCFVMPSRGESLCRPLMDAMCVGNMVIGTGKTGMEDLLTDAANAWIVKSQTTPAMAAQPPLPYLYTGHETWEEVDILHLRSCMREAFLRWKKNPDKTNHLWLQGYNYKSIANTMEQIL